MASVLAFLAYYQSERDRLEFAKSIVFQFARDIAKVRPGWGSSFSISSDNLPAGDAENTAKAGYNILESERLLAGEIGVGMALKACNKIPLIKNKNFGAAEVIQTAISQGAFKSTATGYTRWKSSKRVIHLATAFKLLRSYCQSDSYYEMLELPDGAIQMIETAIVVKTLLLSLNGPRGGPTAVPDFSSFGMLDLETR